MNDLEFQLFEEVEERHFWFVGKRLILRSLLANHPPDGRLLDLGCGTGGVLRDWMRNTSSVGVDRSALALRICADKGFRTLVRGDLSRLPFRPESFDTILALDVIEHLDDDVGFLRNAATVCRRGGTVVAAVPAYQALWSQHDVTFEHRRRYDAHQLEAVVRAAGLTPMRTTYTNTFIFPVAAAWRLLSSRLGLGRKIRHDFWPIPRWMNTTLQQVYRGEARLLERVDLPFGLSVVCLARRS